MVNSVTFNNSGNSYNDGTQAPGNMRNGGHRTNLIPMLNDAVAEVALSVVAATEAKTAGGFSYTWESTTTAADPGTGKIKANHATLASATAIYISETNASAVNIANMIAAWDDSTSTIRGFLKLWKQTDLQTYAIFAVTGTNTDNGTWDTLNVTYVAGNGTFADDDAVAVSFIAKGDKGDTGNTGPAGADGTGFTRPVMTSTGSANAYVLTPGTPLGSYVDQQMFMFEANFANTGAATLNISGLGAKAIRKNFDVALVANDIKSGQLVAVAYEASTDRFQMTSPVGLIAAQSSGGGITLSAAGALGVSALRTIPVMAGAMRPSLTSGCAPLAQVASASNQPDIITLDFDASTEEYAQFSIPMPKGWNEGTITAEFIWSHAATVTNFGVVWAIQAVAVSNDDGIAAAFGTAQTVTDTGGTTNDLYVSPKTSAITVAGTPAAEDVVFFRVYRDATNGSDNLAIDARLHGIRIFATIDTLDDA